MSNTDMVGQCASISMSDVSGNIRDMIIDGFHWVDDELPRGVERVCNIGFIGHCGEGRSTISEALAKEGMYIVGVEEFKQHILDLKENYADCKVIIIGDDFPTNEGSIIKQREFPSLLLNDIEDKFTDLSEKYLKKNKPWKKTKFFE